MNKLIIGGMFRARNKQAFFAIHQIYHKIKTIDKNINIEFNILWDADNELLQQDDIRWKSEIENGGFNICSYTKNFFIDYCSLTYGIDKLKIISNFKNYPAIYALLIPHYLRRTKLYNYYLSYDDDILINYDFKDVVENMLNGIPVMISEPFNSNCDKVLLNKLIELYGTETWNIYSSRNPNMLGFNAGFQGIDLSVFDDFLSADRFELMLNLFNYSGNIDYNGVEIWDSRRFLNDTQEQSFVSCINIIKSRNNPYILDPMTCYVAPNFGSHPILGTLNSEDELNGWGCCLKSKISHFIGHTRNKRKPVQFTDKVDVYLKSNNII